MKTPWEVKIASHLSGKDKEVIVIFSQNAQKTFLNLNPAVMDSGGWGMLSVLKFILEPQHLDTLCHKVEHGLFIYQSILLSNMRPSVQQQKLSVLHKVQSTEWLKHKNQCVAMA